MSSVDFKALRSSVTLEQVLAMLDVKLLKKSNEQLRGPCPICSHQKTFVVTPGKGLWICFSKDCGSKGGDMIALVQKVRGYGDDVRKAALDIMQHFSLNGQKANGEGLSNIASYLQPEHEAVQALGLSKETCIEWGAGFKPKGVLSGRLAIPVHDQVGTLVAYIGHALKKDQETLAFVKDFEPDAYLFNARHFPVGSEPEELMVADNPLKVLVAYQHGLFNVISFIGPPTPRSLKMLAEWMEERLYKNVTLI